MQVLAEHIHTGRLDVRVRLARRAGTDVLADGNVAGAVTRVRGTRRVRDHYRQTGRDRRQVSQIAEFGGQNGDHHPVHDRGELRESDNVVQRRRRGVEPDEKLHFSLLENAAQVFPAVSSGPSERTGLLLGRATDEERCVPKTVECEKNDIFH